MGDSDWDSADYSATGPCMATERRCNLLDGDKLSDAEQDPKAVSNRPRSPLQQSAPPQPAARPTAKFCGVLPPTATAVGGLWRAFLIRAGRTYDLFASENAAASEAGTTFRQVLIPTASYFSFGIVQAPGDDRKTKTRITAVSPIGVGGRAIAVLLRFIERTRVMLLKNFMVGIEASKLLALSSEVRTALQSTGVPGRSEAVHEPVWLTLSALAAPLTRKNLEDLIAAQYGEQVELEEAIEMAIVIEMLTWEGKRRAAERGHNDRSITTPAGASASVVPTSEAALEREIECDELTRAAALEFWTALMRNFALLCGQRLVECECVSTGLSSSAGEGGVELWMPRKTNASRKIRSRLHVYYKAAATYKELTAGALGASIAEHAAVTNVSCIATLMQLVVQACARPAQVTTEFEHQVACARSAGEARELELSVARYNTSVLPVIQSAMVDDEDAHRFLRRVIDVNNVKSVSSLAGNGAQHDSQPSLAGNGAQHDSQPSDIKASRGWWVDAEHDLVLAALLITDMLKTNHDNVLQLAGGSWLLVWEIFALQLRLVTSTTAGTTMGTRDQFLRHRTTDTDVHAASQPNDLHLAPASTQRAAAPRGHLTSSGDDDVATAVSSIGEGILAEIRTANAIDMRRVAVLERLVSALERFPVLGVHLHNAARSTVPPFLTAAAHMSTATNRGDSTTSSVAGPSTTPPTTTKRKRKKTAARAEPPPSVRPSSSLSSAGSASSAASSIPEVSGHATDPA